MSGENPFIVGPEEMAIKVFLGKPIEFCDSGIHLLRFPLECFVRFPKTMYDLDYMASGAITMEGDYPESGSDVVHYGIQPLKVNSVAYVRLPRYFGYYFERQGRRNVKHIIKNKPSPQERKDIEEGRIKIVGGLVAILQSGVPTDAAKLKEFTEEAVVGAVRLAIGSMTWMAVIKEKRLVIREANKVFRSADGALIKAGFDVEDINLTIEQIQLPKELEAALPGPDKARLVLEAAGFVARTRATETVGAVIEMMAKSRGRTIEEIQASVEADPNARQEFLRLSKDLTIRQMGIEGGSYVDIRVEGGGGIENALLAIAAAWKRMPEGKPKKEEKRGREVRVPGGTRTMNEDERKRLGIP